MGHENEFIRFDWAMKHMLREKSNFEILEGLISVLLGQDIKIEEILESESNQDSDSDKFNRVDIKAKNSKGHLIIVEVQLTRQTHYLQRILYGTCKTITEHINLGEKYDQVKKVYSISLLYCDFGEGDDYIYHGTTSFKGLNTGNDLIVRTEEDGVIVPHVPSEYFPEYYLLRVNEFDKLPDTPMNEWMDYLKTGIVKENTRTPGLQRVREKLRVLNMTPADRKAYFRHLDNLMVQNDVLATERAAGKKEGRAEGLAEGRAEGLAEGRAEGLAEGRAEGLAEGRAEGLAEGKAEERRKSIRAMLSFGISAGQIAEKYGISIEEVDRISEGV